MKRIFCVLILIASYAQAASDPLNRTNPRAAVTAFLEACHDSNYARAAEYLDLRQLNKTERARRGPELAQQLEEILNHDSRFNVLKLSLSADGNPADDPNPAIEHIASVQQNDATTTIDLERVELTAGQPVWLFSRATVEAIPALAPSDATSAIEARLPGFLVSFEILETPLWKWIALLIVAFVVLLLFRLAGSLLLMALKRVPRPMLWVQSVLEPWLVLLAAMVFGVAEQFINPSALSRLYIGRAILLVVVAAFAWCAINLIDLFLNRIDSLLDPRQRIVSHSLIYMGRRAAKVAVVGTAAIIVLDNWGYNMTTMIAGLGVGGIAVALAAQGTIANIFGGVSVIADHPVMVGDFGNFGGVMGTVEDIGMRSTRVRTLNRTLMSIPNSAFAGMNLENYAARDKILFNPTLQIKRGVAKEKFHAFLEALEQALRNDKRLDVGVSPIRLTALTAGSIALEIFAYAQTAEIDEFYKIEADLYLEINDALATHEVELA